ncbi:LOW QUALITY PROTEIN: MKI67 FHA domain-interacting nucleolar phosphoprotein-like [Gigantopelta aegis]|uniref:LOW QUALITY PROTEIN: MKI67 FHA domain-interacting nucleolar phosphoprotein-like n=1 Tax=Gigantopelta aegis TaxID=1735272 RepID=UPI001B88961A|nr:LOW QUALITY PROTEIN: MKI67 FHA domain-interacting nucleolar phosphoprotein-like [Gigantopelta aegis]
MAASTKSHAVSKELPKHISLDPDKQKEFETKVKAVKKKKDNASLTPGVVYLGHIPHGFYEKEMTSFFSQFGRVTRLRLARSKKTGASKGYAFIEFRSEDVAKIVAETMNNYLMFEKLLKCQFVEKSIHDETFKGCKRRFRLPKAHLISKRRHNTVKSAAKEKATRNRFMKKQKKRFEKLAKMGIDYKLEDITLVKKTSSESDEVESAKSMKTSPELDTSLKLNTSAEQNATPKLKTTTLTPKSASTPKGALPSPQMDASDEEISFKTPPSSVKSPAKVAVKNSWKNLKRLSKAMPTPETVKVGDGGEVQVLKEDSSDEEISFKTPPNSVKSSKLRRTSSGSVLIKEDTPRSSRSGTRMMEKKLDENKSLALKKSSGSKKTKLGVEKSSSVLKMKKALASNLKKTGLKSSKRLKK